MYTLEFSFYLSKKCPQSWTKVWWQRTLPVLIESFLSYRFRSHSVWWARTPYRQSFGFNFYAPCLRLVHGWTAGWKWNKTNNFIPGRQCKENESGKLPRFGNGFYFSEVNRWPNEAQENNCKNWNLGCLPLCQTDRSEISCKTWGKWNDILRLN